MSLYRSLRPLLHALPPEAAHNLAIFALENRLLFEPKPRHYSALETNYFGLTFPNPLGLAAGFDKNARALSGLLAQGFGFVEAGTVTPQPQPGNPAPRLFRLSEDEAVINRMGFNNAGLAAFVQNFQRRDVRKGIAGANIGKNKTATDPVEDYVVGLHAVYAHADYITVNISSPNTPGLRDLQERAALEPLLSALKTARIACEEKHAAYKPLWLKVAPDLSLTQCEAIAQLVVEYGIDALVVSNTTLARPDSLKSPQAQQQGGLSGRPLMALSTEMLARFYRLLGGRCLLVGAGGIASADDAYRKIRAGAGLLQLYSALVYHGFGLVREICDGLEAQLARDGFSHLREAVGIDSQKL